MKIAQVSPLYESVPPSYYGGTERIVHYITEELVAQGHDVTLFASGDSKTRAKLVEGSKTALRLNKQCVDPLAAHFTMIEMIEREAYQFDIIHSHIDYLYYPLMKRNQHHYITTLHGRLDIPELQPLYHEFSQVPVVSISDSQRKPLPHANWKGTVYHGMPTDLYSFYPVSEQYLAFIGRISPEKRIDRAIDIAIKAGIPVRIAAKIDKADQEYFDLEIRKLFEHPLVEYLGEINGHEKEELLGNALGLIFPIDWPEPFGLAMIEAMACGTPVIAYNCGSVPEVVEEGITGFIVNSRKEAVEAVGKLSGLSRRKCREVFEQRFSVKRMVDDYLKIYEDMRETGNIDFSHTIKNHPENMAYGTEA
jgi:glycosyltransferase involved in cell wall biosynthesis